MKKTIAVVFLIVSIFLSAFCFTLNTYSAQAQGEKTQGESELISAQAMEKSLEYFLNISSEKPNGDLGVRTPFSVSERAAAQRIASFAQNLKTSQDALAYSVTTHAFSDGSDSSQNIIIKKQGTKQNERKQIIFGANYDGVLYAHEQSSDTNISFGAMDNATGCAVLLSLMDYYKNIETEHDLIFAFFGADQYSLSGSYKYVQSMSAVQKQNTLIMFNVKRFGGDYLYIYSEEVKTAHNDFLYSLVPPASSFRALPKNLPIISAVAVERIPYTHWAMIGAHSAFMNEHINVANIFSGNLNTSAVNDLESAGLENRSGTVGDTYQNLKKDLPEYKSQMAQAAELIVQAMSASDFEAVMVQSRAEFKGYDMFTQKLVAIVVLLGMIIICATVIVIAAKKLEKKYPPTPPTMRKIKLAVFGADYENKDSNDIFIDFK